MTEDVSVQKEVLQRRTFAIISHPDAGKTTLTEKLLLYAGMIRTAGMVRGRKARKAVSSDWMELERERGISITASAMQFRYKDVVINVLDTPGHQDFSEDTYRTLTAADSAVMVIDAAKGVEPQTRKLFAVCRMRGIPILTFVNKMDLPGRDSLDLLAEVEEALGIDTSPLNWPIGSGKDFRGVVDLRTQQVILFEKTVAGEGQKAPSSRHTFQSVTTENLIDQSLWQDTQETLELVQEAGTPFETEAFLRGELTPVFFGSALTNFGVEPFFDSFSELAPVPHERPATSDSGDRICIEPAQHPFSGYVFKIQANMDPRHRDSMAFLRVCSGRFERDLVVKHDRLQREIRLSRSHAMFGGDRNTVDDAYPGDIVGLVNPGVFAIGDTVSVEGGFSYLPMPKFPPEVVAVLRPKDVMKRKAFDKGMEQFRTEGAVLILERWDGQQTEPLVAAVGPLQFEVLQHRLENEYGVPTQLDMLPYQHGAWLLGDPDAFETSSATLLAKDPVGQPLFLYSKEWERGFALEKNPEHQLVEFLSGTEEAIPEQG